MNVVPKESNIDIAMYVHCKGLCDLGILAAYWHLVTILMSVKSGLGGK